MIFREKKLVYLHFQNLNCPNLWLLTLLKLHNRITLESILLLFGVGYVFDGNFLSPPHSSFWLWFYRKYACCMYMFCMGLYTSCERMTSMSFKVSLCHLQRNKPNIILIFIFLFSRVSFLIISIEIRQYGNVLTNDTLRWLMMGNHLQYLYEFLAFRDLEYLPGAVHVAFEFNMNL